MRRTRIVQIRWWAVSTLLLLVLLAACGGGSSGEAAAVSSTSEPVATMPPARFTAVAQQAELATVVISATAPAVETPKADNADLERGANIYVKRQCGDCHGAQGEGMPGEGSALAGTPLALQEFDDILRTGGNGELGPDHLYGQSAISPGGMNVLYAWLQSLPAQ